MAAQVAQRSMAALLLTFPPADGPRQLEAGAFEIGAAEMGDGPKAAGLDEIVGEAQSRDEAVIEAGGVDDTRLLRCLPHGSCFFSAAGQRLLAEDMLAGSGSSDRGLGVEVVGTSVDHKIDIICQQLVPVGDSAL